MRALYYRLGDVFPVVLCRTYCLYLGYTSDAIYINLCKPTEMPIKKCTRLSSSGGTCWRDAVVYQCFVPVIHGQYGILHIYTITITHYIERLFQPMSSEIQQLYHPQTTVRSLVLSTRLPNKKIMARVIWIAEKIYIVSIAAI